MLKKFLTLSLLIGSAIVFVPSAEAKTVNSEATASTFQWQRNRRGNQRSVRIVVRTVRRGRALYRETYRVVTNRNGRTTTTLVSRVRISR
jgi:predicted GNAT superfamily acetyltransferase